MALTFTEQANLVGGTVDGATDGEGLHSHLFFDAVRGLNNISTKVNNFAHYAQGMNGGVVTRAVVGSGHQIMMAQFPAMVPPWRARMLWIAGVSCSAGEILGAKVYLSPAIYTGPDPDSEAFNPDFLVNASSSTVSLAITSGYGLADDSTVGIAPVPRQLFLQGNFATYGAVVVTLTLDDDSTASLCDFTCWFAPQ